MFIDALASLRGALDLRARVDRLVEVDPVRALDERIDGAKHDDRPTPRGVATPSTSGAPPDTRLVVGAAVTLRVIAIPDAFRVVAQLDDQLFELAWPTHDAPLPTRDTDIALRVVTTEPTITFSRVERDLVVASRAPVDLEAPQLRATSRAIDGDDTRPGVVRFETPLVAVSRTDAAPEIARTPATSVDTPVASSLVPLVLHGPAWQDQPVELVFHRERADESFDNGALDAWCGEVTIDLPQLGRVAAHLAFSMHGLRVRIEGDNDDAVRDLSDASRDLAAAFNASDLRVAQLSVGRLSADAMQPDARHAAR